MTEKKIKIYTKKGDHGATGLRGLNDVDKYDPRIEAIGDVDELNAVLGVAAVSAREYIWLNVSAELPRLQTIQGDLLTIGSVLSCWQKYPPGYFTYYSGMDRMDWHERYPAPAVPPLAPMLEQLEAWIDAAEETLPPLKNFILPGGNKAAASLHLARAVCRRAERSLWRLWEWADEQKKYYGDSNGITLAAQYLNRLSDLLFVWARVASDKEIIWEPPKLEED